MFPDKQLICLNCGAVINWKRKFCRFCNSIVDNYTSFGEIRRAVAERTDLKFHYCEFADIHRDVRMIIIKLLGIGGE